MGSKTEYGSASQFVFPTMEDRVAVLGRTGSGKSVAGSWLLSKAPFDRIPYVVIDYKGEKIFTHLERIKEIGLHERIPKKPGLYIVRPSYGDDEQVEEWLLRLWKQGNTGLFVDEGYMLPNKRGINSILTQGRAKNIPLIMLSQRPVKVTKWLWSEADYYMVFYFNTEGDEDTVSSYAPIDFQKKTLKRHSIWYDVKEDRLFNLAPVPPPDEIEEVIDQRLAPKQGKVRFL